MKKLFASIVFLACTSLSAQLTTVSGTVIDSDGTTWANGTWTMQFVPAPNQSNLNVYTLGGVSITSPTYVQYLNQSGSLSGNGTFSFSSLDNSLITPVGSQLKITFCPQATSLCGSVSLPISGPAITIGAPTITAAIPAPRFPGAMGNYGYADIEAQVSLTPGSLYYNVTSQCYRQYNPNSLTWTCLSTSLATRIIECSTGQVCSNTIRNNGWVVTGGPIPLVLGLLTITGINPSFTSDLTYKCYAWDVTTPSNSVGCINDTGSSFSVIGTGVDSIQYLLIGN